ncbi:MAG TPA: asparaginase [Leucothrix sp.]|nr:asparaginase [Leucothrix sp.]HIQ16012.1 asparaginase [Leucothrix sp.]
MSIKLLLTGGTIDKHYNESNGELDFVDSYIPEILQLGRNHTEIEIQQLMFKDSLDMDDNDRQIIFTACQQAIQERILITHGTDTMVETAGVIAGLNTEKTIVLLGAMVPYVFKHTDAVFNFGFALAAVQTLPHGVYIAMNGQVFTWDSVRKNRALGVFENI